VNAEEEEVKAGVGAPQVEHGGPEKEEGSEGDGDGDGEAKAVCRTSAKIVSTLCLTSCVKAAPVRSRKSEEKVAGSGMVAVEEGKEGRGDCERKEEEDAPWLAGDEDEDDAADDAMEETALEVDVSPNPDQSSSSSSLDRKPASGVTEGVTEVEPEETATEEEEGGTASKSPQSSSASSSTGGAEDAGGNEGRETAVTTGVMEVCTVEPGETRTVRATQSACSSKPDESTVREDWEAAASMVTATEGCGDGVAEKKISASATAGLGEGEERLLLARRSDRDERDALGEAELEVGDGV
jgi:hypothetical protein